MKLRDKAQAPEMPVGDHSTPSLATQVQALARARTSSAVFHFASCDRRFCPAQTEVWMIFRKSCPVRGLKMKMAPFTSGPDVEAPEGSEMLTVGQLVDLYRVANPSGALSEDPRLKHRKESRRCKFAAFWTALCPRRPASS